MTKEEHYKAIDDLAHDLGIFTNDLYRWIKREHKIISFDHMQRPAISSKCIGEYSTSSSYCNARRKYIMAEIAQRKADDNPATKQFFQLKRLALLDQYNTYIDDLKKLHKQHLHNVNAAGYESPTMAAYLLFAKVISTLKMVCSNLRHGYLYCGSSIREIDETLNLAEHFVITAQSPKGEKDLLKWFRQNRSPKNQDCRKSISTLITSVDPTYDQKNNEALMNELYQKKSKFTHSAYSVIHESTKLKINEHGECIIEQIDYGPCSNEAKLYELCDFFISSIWTSFQIFKVCFHPLLTEAQSKLLTDYDKFFLRKSKKS